MKAFKFFAMLIAAAAISFTATSCGDDVPDSIDEIIEDIENGKLEKSANITKTNNSLTLTMEVKGVATSKMVAKFDSNKICTSCILTETYKSKELADQAWEEWKDDEDYPATRSDKTITVDYATDAKGLHYDTILKWFELEKDEFLHPEE